MGGRTPARRQIRGHGHESRNARAPMAATCEHARTEAAPCRACHGNDDGRINGTAHEKRPPAAMPLGCCYARSNAMEDTKTRGVPSTGSVKRSSRDTRASGRAKSS